LLFDPWVAVELAEQGIAVPACPVGEVLDELLDLGAGRFLERTGAAVVDGVSFDEFGFELVLADELAQAITDAGATGAVSVAIAGLRRPFIRFEEWFAVAIANSEFFHGAEADSVRLAESTIDSPSLGDSHLGATD
jgi:hypothetical protein